MACHKDDLVPVDCGGDGDCCFRSLRCGRYGDVEKHWDLRASVCGKLMRDSSRYIDYHADGETTYTEFVARLQKKGVYVETEIELRAAAEVLEVNLHIHGFSEHHDKLIVPETNNNGTVHLAHYDVPGASAHYRLAVRRGSKCPMCKFGKMLAGHKGGHRRYQSKGGGGRESEEG